MHGLRLLQVPGGPEPSEADARNGMAEYRALLCRRLARFDWIPRTSDPQPRASARGSSIADVFSGKADDAAGTGATGQLVRPCVATKELTGGLFLQLWEQNYAASQVQCREVLKKLVSTLRARVAAVERGELMQFASIVEFDESVSEVTDLYNSQAIGPATATVLAEFVRGCAKDREAVQMALIKSQMLEHVKQQVSSLAEQLTAKLQEEVTLQKQELDTLRSSSSKRADELQAAFVKGDEEVAAALAQVRESTEARAAATEGHVATNKSNIEEQQQASKAHQERAAITDNHVHKLGEIVAQNHKELSQNLQETSTRLDEKFDGRLRSTEQSLRQEQQQAVAAATDKMEATRTAQEASLAAVRQEQRDALEKIGQRVTELSVATATLKEGREADQRSRSELEERVAAQNAEQAQKNATLSSNHDQLRSQHEQQVQQHGELKHSLSTQHSELKNQLQDQANSSTAQVESAKLEVSFREILVVDGRLCS